MFRRRRGVLSFLSLIYILWVKVFLPGGKKVVIHVEKRLRFSYLEEKLVVIPTGEEVKVFLPGGKVGGFSNWRRG